MTFSTQLGQSFSGPLQHLSAFSERRQTVAEMLSVLADRLTQAEAEGLQKTDGQAEKTDGPSGQLGLSGAIAELSQTAQDLKSGVYRLMIMGDMKRGKSTLVNALIGENLLPSDVNPCTALMTHLRYGEEKQILLHFKDGRPPEMISFERFRERYTIDPAESKRLEADNQEAFPDISHVVVEYPLPLLASGLSLVDTPGLNDTEARNDQVIRTLNDCHGVLFVLDATQPMTLDEQRYLDNYLRDSGLAIFFVVNGWDRLQSGLINPNDQMAVAAAEDKIRAVFSTQLAPYIPEEVTAQRAGRYYEISALKALRQQVKGEISADEADTTGVRSLLDGLDRFLAQERGPAELQRAVAIAEKAQRSVTTAIGRRIPLLDETLETLVEKVDSVQSDFEELESIRDRYRDTIQTTSEQQAKTLSEGFKTYVLNLESTFEEDFAESQPNLEFVEFLEKDKRQNFYREFKRSFERYINDRLSAWGFTAKQSIGTAFDELNASADEYQVAYAEVVEVIHEKIMGQRYYAVGQTYDPKSSTIWIDSIKDVFEEIPENMNNSVRGFNYFWQSVLQGALAYICVVIALQILGLIFSSLFLNIVGVVLAAGGIVAAQAEFVRQQFLTATRKEFAKHLPKIANEQSPNIYRAVKDCFKAYETQAIGRIDQDIRSRRTELSSLVEQKQSHRIQKDQEIERLNQLKADVTQQVETLTTSAAA